MDKIKEFFKKHSKIITFGAVAVVILALSISTAAYKSLYKKAKIQPGTPVDAIHDTLFATRNIVYIDTVHVVDTMLSFIEIKGEPDTVYIETPASKKNGKKNKK